jgi:phosphate transport system permease protein
MGTAIYLSEYAQKGWLTRLIRLAIVNLAGVPSVIYGLFGLGLFAIALGLGRSLATGAIALGLLTLPVIITTSEEALRAVPRSHRDASLALGASQWQTVRNVVLPQAIPSMLTGVVLGLGRAAGETAPIMFTAAAFYRRDLPGSIFEQVMALPYHIYVVAAHAPNVPTSMAYAAAAVLLTFVLIFLFGAVGYRTWLRLRLNK